MKLLNIIILAILFLHSWNFASAQSAENQQMAFEGSLTDINGNPISLAGATLNFYISANGCYLYGESSSVAGDSQGNILHRFGSGTVAGGSPNSFSQNLFFGNAVGTTTFAGNNCSVSAADTRIAQVYYPAQNITAAVKLGTVPYAQNATQLGGKSANAFVQSSTDTNTVFSGGAAGQYLMKSSSGLTWSTVTATVTSSTVTNALGYVPANSSSLGALASKNSVDLNGVEVTGTLPVTKLPSLGGDISNAAGSGNITVNRIRNIGVAATAPATGQVLAYDGTAWAPTTIAAGSSGTVTNVSSTNSDIVVLSNTTTPTLTLNAGTGANQILRLDSLGRYPGLDASNVTNLNASQLTFGTIDSNRLPAFTGDVVSAVGSNTVTVTRLRGVNIATTPPTNGQVLSYNGSQWAPSSLTATDITNALGYTPGSAAGSITSLNGSSSGVQSFANGTAGNSPAFNTVNGVHTLNIPLASTTGSVTAGLISNADYANFNNKITSSAASVVQVLGYVPAASGAAGVGTLLSANNLSDLASTAIARTNLGLGAFATANSLDLGSVAATGVIADARLANQSGVTSGTQYTKVTVDGKGRVTSGAQLSAADVTAALGYTPGNSLAGVTSLNGSTSQTQVLANGTSGNSPAFVTVNGVHTLNIPLASATGSVTAGLISNIDYVNFSNKITSSAVSVAQVLGYTPASATALGSYLVKANNLADLTSSATARTNLGLGTFATASTIDLGSASATGTLAAARLPAFAGDLTSASGSNILTLGNSGVTASTYTKVTVNTKGLVTSGGSLTSSDVTTALGYTPVSGSVASQWTTSGSNINYATGNVGIGVVNPATSLDVAGAIKVGTASPSCTSATAGAIHYSGTVTKQLEMCNGVSWTILVQQGGNDSPGLATTGFAIGTNDFTPLLLKTNNVSRMTISETGNVGIGTNTPAAILDVTSNGTAGSAIVVPRDSTVNRPSTAAAGMIRYNTDDKNMEVYQGTTPSWNTLQGTVQGGARVDRTNLTGTIAWTDLFTPAAASPDFYNICVFMQTTAAGVSGSVTASIRFNSEAGLVWGGAGVTIYSNLSSYSSYCSSIYATSGAPVQYSTTVSGTPGTYSIHIRVTNMH